MSIALEMRSTIRSMVRSTYQLQKLRIQMGNRIVANFRVKLGIVSTQKEEDLEKDEKKLLDDIRDTYKKIMDGVLQMPNKKKFKGVGYITEYAELCLIDQYMTMEREEESHFRRLGRVLEDFPIYAEFLEKVRGIGPAMAGVLVSEIDITKCYYPASLWKYAGLDVVTEHLEMKDGVEVTVFENRGRGRYKEHLVDREYMDKEGEVQVKKSITFNPFLKTKLLGVVGPSFLRSKSPYAEVYYDYKNRYEVHPAHKDKSKGHRHNMAMRAMVKRFLVDLHINWRMLEGLPVGEEFSVRRLGLVHRRAA